MTSLPPPSSDQAYCRVSALEAGFIDLPLHLFLANADSSLNQKISAPSLSFFIQHSKHPKTFLFDLGIRKDWESYPPGVVQRIKSVYHNGIHIPNDVCDSLAKGSISPTEIDTVCISHLHWDHVSTAAPFTNSTFFVGAESKPLLESGADTSRSSVFANDLPPERTKFIPPESEGTPLVQPLGPFPRAFDFYGDGSLYIVDAPGHIRGHINVLARTSSDGGWIYLAGDSAHHWSLITGESEIADHGSSSWGCAHEDKKSAEEHIARIRELMKIPRVRVLLAHDESWYRENKSSSAFFPGEIESK